LSMGTRRRLNMSGGRMLNAGRIGRLGVSEWHRVWELGAAAKLSGRHEAVSSGGKSL
jgi:hypothetical protein